MSYPAKNATDLTKGIVSDFHDWQKGMERFSKPATSSSTARGLRQTTTEETKIIVNSIPAAICACADDIALTQCREN